MRLEPSIDSAKTDDPYRLREEVQRAHDLLVFVVTTEKVRDALLDNPELLAGARGALDVLCWALRHDHNQSFDHNLTALERCVRNMGYKIHRYEEMQYPNPALKPSGVPEIERMADELAAARMEIADLNQIIEDLKRGTTDAAHATN